MYYDNDSESRTQIENERILKMISSSPAEACSSDPKVKAAFEESLRHLAEDIIEYNPSLAHILLGMSDGGDPASLHGRN
ncbi:MAG: hypothetical protein P1U89_03575 [Verrucomicrobiales bacterium]|nr:hypothetical protein [Verrucomicrobiales bacterium]